MRSHSRRQSITVLTPLSRAEQGVLVGGAPLPTYRAPSLAPLVEPNPHPLAELLLALASTPR